MEQKAAHLAKKKSEGFGQLNHGWATMPHEEHHMAHAWPSMPGYPGRKVTLGMDVYGPCHGFRLCLRSLLASTALKCPCPCF